MKLFLTSLAAFSLPKLLPYLDQNPSKLTVAFVPTAAGLSPQAPWVDQDREVLLQLGFKVVDVDIAGKTEQQLRKSLKDIDILFVAGGNTFYLLEQSRKSGFDKIAKELIAKNIWYIGSSAGSVLLGPDIEMVDAFDDKSVAQLDSYEGFGIVDFVVLPHDDIYPEENKIVIKQFEKRFRFIPLKNTEAVLVLHTEEKVL